MGNPVTFGDLLHLTRYALRFEQDLRALKCSNLLARVCEARAFVQITGQAHPLYGDGSISAITMRFGLARFTGHIDLDSLQAYAIALDEVAFFMAGAECIKPER